MKRTFILTLLMFILSISALFSDPADVTKIIAFDGSFGVDLASNDYGRRTPVAGGKFNGGLEYVGTGDGAGPSQYGTKQTVAHGGLFNMGQNISGSNPTYRVTFTCDNGFNFVNNSNPVYQRPFKFQVLQNYVNTGDGFVLDLQDNLIYNDFAEFTFVWDDSIDLSGTKDESKFDLILVLEGEVKNGTLTIGGESYALAEGEYSAVVTITVEGWYYNSNGSRVDLPTKMVTIPFSGYYYGDESTDVIDDTIGVSVLPTYNAASLDIATMAGSQYPIASLDVLKYLNSSASIGDDDIRIFLSSSHDPFTDGGEFALVHTSVPVGGLLTSANHVGYTAYIVNSETRDADGIFKGDATFEKVMQAQPDSYSYVSVPCAFNEEISGTAHHYHTYNGDIYIEMEHPSTTMLPGMYRSTIYVHVICNEGRAN